MNELTQTTEDSFRTGYIAIVGRPNVGKSTLLNRMIGQKVSIVSSKAQTTRHRIHGILTVEGRQFIFVDTPGFQTQHRNALNRTMNRSVVQTLQDVDVVFLVIEAGRFGSKDREVLRLIPEGKAVFLVINKTDELDKRDRILPFIAQVSSEFAFTEVVPVSASKGKGIDALLEITARYLPEGDPVFEPDDVTDRSERFLAAEFIREKLFRRLGDELPYGLTVEIEKFEQEGALRRVHAAIIVDRPAHKGIVIGAKGEQLKEVASAARRDMESLFGGRVFLETWVKVRSGWADDERALKSLGYD